MEQKSHFPELIALKGLFILVIVLHNTLSVTPLFSHVPGTSFLILFGGALGNSMFFLLSGFLLAGSYRDKIRLQGLSFPDFLLRRLKKLYPMYLLSNAAALLLEICWYGLSAINIEKIVFTLLLLRGPYNSPTGFLCSLFACYILFYAVCHFAKTPTRYLVCLVMVVLAGYTLMDKDPGYLVFNGRNGHAFLNFFLGCLLAEGYPRLSQKQHRWMQPLFLLLVPALLGLMLSYGVQIIAGDVRVAFAFVLCPMILYLALVKGPCSAILRFKGFVALGNISSYIFFWHLVLYFAFCDLYSRAAQGAAIREPQYLLYIVLLIAFCAGCAGLKKRKASGKGAAV